MPISANPRSRRPRRLIARTTAPVINDPRAVMKTGRIDNAARLGALPGVVTPKTMAIKREVLAGPGGVAAVADLGFAFPLLLRSPGYHTGRNFISCRERVRIIRGGGRSSRRRTAGHRISRCPWPRRQRAEISRDDDRRPDLSVASGDIAKLEGALFHLRHGRQAGPSVGGGDFPRRYARPRLATRR